MITNQITKDEVLSVLDYDKENGVFRWKKALSSRSKVGDIAGTRHMGGYWMIQIKKTRYLLHRLVWLVENGSMPSNCIDHIDRNKNNSKISNLRIATISENGQNMKTRISSITGFKGVSFAKHAKKFQAQIAINGENMYLGRFNTAEAAHEAYVKASIELHPFSIYREPTPSLDSLCLKGKQ